MPYNGMDKRKTEKVDRCVEKVMSTGKSKDVAIAICRKSIDASEDYPAIHEFVISEYIRKYESSKITNTN